MMLDALITSMPSSSNRLGDRPFTPTTRVRTSVRVPQLNSEYKAMLVMLSYTNHFITVRTTAKMVIAEIRIIGVAEACWHS